jgi:CubicO group peptidase (beta-lactamase class C family)
VNPDRTDPTDPTSRTNSKGGNGATQALEEVFARWALIEHSPAISWGLIRDGELVATGSLGTLRVGEDSRPDADSVFRIASMTKSFTGAALMSLVVEGRARLDEPVATYVPELADWRGPTTDGPPLTVRHLVSMESGLPSDDPWADRHLDLSPTQMDALIAQGASFTWTPGTRFEYSNLGWGLVGRVIERVAGVTPQELITTRLLGPLGMTSTTWTRPPGPNVAEPFRWQDEAWVAEPEPITDGTIAPMGGLWSTVRDLARWVAFFCDADPPRDDLDGGPIPRWARREMQQPRRMDSIDRVRPRPDGPARHIAFGYGIGLAMRLDPRLGNVVAHSGGLPGYGSHMRWLPDRGVGIVALSNITYGNMTAACAEALDVLADLDALPLARDLVGTQALIDAADRALELVIRWDDAAARALVADNVEQDDALDRRSAEAADVVARRGTLTRESLEVDAPQRGDLVAADGHVRIELELNHEPKVQWWRVLDREKPSDAPIITDPRTLADLPRSACVVLRPAADLADAFDRWQNDVLDRIGGTRCTLPAPHATLKAFGSTDGPIDGADERRIVDVVAAWAAATQPIELRADALDVFDGDEAVPVMLLSMSDPLTSALRILWARAAEANLPPSASDRIGAEAWRAHLSLCYPRTSPPGSIWEPLRTWMQHQEAGGVSSLAYEAELVAFGDGVERRLGRFPFTR